MSPSDVFVCKMSLNRVACINCYTIWLDGPLGEWFSHSYHVEMRMEHHVIIENEKESSHEAELESRSGETTLVAMI